MTENNFTPPPELVKQWLWSDDYSLGPLITITSNRLQNVATQAAQWGADKELESCMDWIAVYQGLEHPELLIALLRAARRPQLPSMKEQSLRELSDAYDSGKIDDTTYDTIRRALKTQ